MLSTNVRTLRSCSAGCLLPSGHTLYFFIIVTSYSLFSPQLSLKLLVASFCNKFIKSSSTTNVPFSIFLKSYSIAFNVSLTSLDLSSISIGASISVTRTLAFWSSAGNFGWCFIGFPDLSTYPLANPSFYLRSVNLPLILTLVELNILAQAVRILMIVSGSELNYHFVTN